MSSKENEAPKPLQFNLLPKIINGSISGIVGLSVVFPLDLVKTRLQNQTVTASGEKQYINMIDCLKKTYAAEGFFGMYRGAAVIVVCTTPENAIALAANDMFRYYLTQKDGSLPVLRQMVAGGLAGACQIVINTPMELLKIQMQDAGRVAAKDRTAVKTHTALELTQKLIRERGIFGLYRGIIPTAMRNVSFSVIFFPLFATLSDFGPKEIPGGPARFWWSFISGCIAGSISALTVTPLDVIKTRMQTLTRGAGERHYSSIVDCIHKTLIYEGPTAFYKGGTCRIIVISTLCGVGQTVYHLGIAEYLMDLK